MLEEVKAKAKARRESWLRVLLTWMNMNGTHCGWRCEQDDESRFYSQKAAGALDATKFFAVLLGQAISFVRLDSSVFGKSKLCLMFNCLSALFEKQIAIDIFRSRHLPHTHLNPQSSFRAPQIPQRPQSAALIYRLPWHALLRHCQYFVIFLVSKT